jgi:hypothetical protein
VGDVKRDIYNNYLVDATATKTFTTLFNVPSAAYVTNYTEIVDELNLFNPTTGIYDAPFTLSTGDSYNFQVDIDYSINLLNSSGAIAYLIDLGLIINNNANYSAMYIRPFVATDLKLLTYQYLELLLVMICKLLLECKYLLYLMPTSVLMLWYGEVLIVRLGVLQLLSILKW